MQHRISNAAPADYLSISARPCPLCAGSLTRTPERPIDEFWSLFVPVHRFRCNRFSCQWTGNLRIDPDASSQASGALR